MTQAVIAHGSLGSMTQKTDVWTIKAALDWTQAYFERRGEENPRLCAQTLLSATTGLSRIDLYISFERPLDQSERDILHDAIVRRASGEPLQYIAGTTGFRHLTLQVNKGVLIPRPETEVLVDEALSFLANKKMNTNNKPLVVDLCTGSACIACAIASENSQAQLIATDIDTQALKLAQKNILQCGLEKRVILSQGDLGDAVCASYHKKIDLIVSNPPYIPTTLLDELPSEVSAFEPRRALDGGADGLDFLRRIVVWAYQVLADKSALIVELHEDSLDEATCIAQTAGFSSIRVIEDLNKRPRFLFALR